jgi:2-polyprenyl-3-methyl-5-hydroxy-6-metoxy-1,4-benzoquinol methylase
MVTKHTNCSLCNSNGYTIFKKVDSYQLMRCKRCGLVSLNPLQVPQEINKEYSAEYHIDRLLKKEPQTEEEIEEEINKTIEMAEEIGKQFVKRGKLLDIGCSAGFFMACLKRYGWDVTGIDISEWAGKFAMDRLGLEVFTGNIEDIQFSDKFNVVTMNHVLEHLSDPLRTLKKVSEIIAKDGVLIINGPNLNSFDRIWHGVNWRGYDLPYHLYHFTPITYQAMLEKAGFSVQRIIFRYWDPISHLLEIKLGDGIRADHHPHAFEGITKRNIYQKAKKNYVLKVITKIIRIMARVSCLRGRDLTIYAKKKNAH